MVDFAEGVEDWAANKFVIAPGLKILIDGGVLTLGQGHTIEQAADILINAITELMGKKGAHPSTDPNSL